MTAPREGPLLLFLMSRFDCTRMQPLRLLDQYTGRAIIDGYATIVHMVSVSEYRLIALLTSLEYPHRSGPLE